MLILITKLLISCFVSLIRVVLLDVHSYNSLFSFSGRLKRNGAELGLRVLVYWPDSIDWRRVWIEV
ncbi:hypothetical protein Hanom_Chr01g00045101 [Helianthus anomalus]